MEIGLSLSLTSNKGGGWGRASVSLTPAARPPGMTYRRHWRGNPPFQPKTLSYVKDNAAPASVFDNANGVISSSALAPYCLVAHGDSITQGSVVESWVERTVRSLARRGILTDYKNRGIGGQSFNYAWAAGNSEPTLILDAPAEVDAVLSNGKINKLVVWAGTNGLKLQANTPATELGYATTYVDDRIAAGWTPDNITLVTMLPRETYNEANRGTFNAGLVSLASTKGCRLAAVHSNALIGLAGQQNNATYFSDTIHLTDLGQRIAAGIIEGVMFP